MTSAVLTPFVSDAALNTSGRTWRKKLLPIGDIRYKGSVLKFTRDYLTRLASTFSQRAYDQVPFQLAPDDNRHTNDVERFAGEITSMDVEPDGLWITLSATERGQKVLTDNPRCGVSARIVEDYDRADGKFFPAAVQHVLATLDPRIPGLGGWQAVEASNVPDDQIWDLSNLEFSGQEEGGTGMPELTEEQRAKLGKLLNIPDDEFDKIVANLTAPPAPVPVPPAGQPPAGSEDEDDELVKMIEAMSDEELAALESEFEAETAATAAATGLSAEAQMAIEMANVRADETERQLGVITSKMDDDAYEAEKQRLTRAGIAPHITELAKPLLHGSGHVVDLSGGTGTVDAGQVMRAVLTEVGKMSRMLDLGNELGTPMDEPDSAGAEAADKARGDLVSRYKSMTGLG